MLKGILDIKVYDENHNLKQHETGENLITNYTADFLKQIYGNPDLRMLGWEAKPILMSDAKYPFNGILLLGNRLAENADNYFTQIVDSQIIGHGDSLAQQFVSSKYGTQNLVASENNKNSVTRVWNFGRGVATGQIQSVALCNNGLGRMGSFDTGMMSDTTYTHFFDSGNGRDAQSHIYLRAMTVYKPIPDGQDEITLNFMAYKDGIIYAYYLETVEEPENAARLSIYTITLSKYYAKQNFSSDIRNDNYATYLYSDTIQPVYSAIIDWLPGWPWYGDIKTAVYGDDVYILTSFNILGNNPGLALYKFNMTSKTLTLISSGSLTGQETELYNYTKGFAINANGVYLPKVNTNFIGRFTQDFIYINDIEIDAAVTVGDGSDDLRIGNFNADGKLLIRNARGDFIRMAVTDFNHYAFLAPENYNIYAPSTFKNMIGIRKDDGYETLYIYPLNTCISTIKNLTNPVNKGANDEMVVTYRVIKTDT